jgi:hypothetical protein
MRAPFDATPLWRLAQARLFARSTRLWLAQGDIPARRGLGTAGRFWGGASFRMTFLFL